MTLNVIGVDVPAGSDVFDPQQDFVDLGLSLEGRVVVPVANQTARDALAGVVTPSTTTPLLVFRSDTGGIEASTSGTSFVKLTPAVRSGQAAGTTSGGGEISVTFSSAMPSASYSVAITDTNVGGGIGMVFWKVRAKTTTGFVARAMPATGSTPVTAFATTFDWTATENI